MQPKLKMKRVDSKKDKLKKSAVQNNDLPLSQNITAQQFKLIYNNLSDVVFLIAVEPNEKYRFVSVNNSFLQTTGLDKEQVIGKFAHEIKCVSPHDKYVCRR